MPKPKPCRPQGWTLALNRYEMHSGWLGTTSRSPAKHKRYHQHESQQWLHCAEGLLENRFEPLKAVVFEKLEAIVHAAALVELVKAFLRPSLHSSKGPITPETCNLLRVYPTQRRDKRGTRQGKAPMELWTGDACKADWGALCIQHTQETSPGPALTSSTPLAPVPHHHARTTPAQTPPGEAI